MYAFFHALSSQTGSPRSFLRPLLGFDQAFLHQAAVELLDVGVHTLPVGLVHADQVVGVQQGGTASQPPTDRQTDRQTDGRTDGRTESATVSWRQRKKESSDIRLHRCSRTGAICFSLVHSLGGAEGQLEVLPGLVGVQDGVLEGIREEAVH